MTPTLPFLLQVPKAAFPRNKVFLEALLVLKNTSEFLRKSSDETPPG